MEILGLRMRLAICCVCPETMDGRLGGGHQLVTTHKAFRQKLSNSILASPFSEQSVQAW